MSNLTYAHEVGMTILGQINRGVMMALGASDRAIYRSSDGKEAGLSFTAGIHPFNKNGKRAGRARRMKVVIKLNGFDYYDVSVGYLNKFDWVEHFSITNVDCFSLNALLLSLDWDGPVPTNPAYWPGA